MEGYKSHLPHTFTSLLGGWRKTLPPRFYEVWNFLPYLPWNKSCRIIQTKPHSCSLELAPHNWPWSHPVPSVSCSSCIIFFFKDFFIWLWWVFTAPRGLSRVAVSNSYSSLWWADFSCCRAWALGTWASVVVAHGLSCSLAGGIFPQPETEPTSPVLQGRFLTTGQPGKPPLLSFLMYGTKMIGIWHFGSILLFSVNKVINCLNLRVIHCTFSN